MKWNKVKVKKWVTDARKEMICVRLDQRLMTDGYSILFIDDQVEEILKELFITDNVCMRNGVDMTLMDIGQLTGSLDDYKRVILSPFTVEHNKNNLQVLVWDVRDNDIRNFYVDKKCVQLIHTKLDHTICDWFIKPDRDGFKTSSLVKMHCDGEPMIYILPYRMESNFKVVY